MYMELHLESTGLSPGDVPITGSMPNYRQNPKLPTWTPLPDLDITSKMSTSDGEQDEVAFDDDDRNDTLGVKRPRSRSTSTLDTPTKTMKKLRLNRPSGSSVQGSSSSDQRPAPIQRDVNPLEAALNISFSATEKEYSSLMEGSSSEELPDSLSDKVKVPVQARLPDYWLKAPAHMQSSGVSAVVTSPSSIVSKPVGTRENNLRTIKARNSSAPRTSRLPPTVPETISTPAPSSSRKRQDPISKYRPSKYVKSSYVPPKPRRIESDYEPTLDEVEEWNEADIAPVVFGKVRYSQNSSELLKGLASRQNLRHLLRGPKRSENDPEGKPQSNHRKDDTTCLFAVPAIPRSKRSENVIESLFGQSASEVPSREKTPAFENGIPPEKKWPMEDSTDNLTFTYGLDPSLEYVYAASEEPALDSRGTSPISPSAVYSSEPSLSDNVIRGGPSLNNSEPTLLAASIPLPSKEASSVDISPQPPHQRSQPYYSTGNNHSLPNGTFLAPNTDDTFPKEDPTFSSDTDNVPSNDQLQSPAVIGPIDTESKPSIVTPLDATYSSKLPHSEDVLELISPMVLQDDTLIHKSFASILQLANHDHITPLPLESRFKMPVDVVHNVSTRPTTIEESIHDIEKNYALPVNSAGSNDDSEHVPEVDPFFTSHLSIPDVIETNSQQNSGIVGNAASQVEEPRGTSNGPITYIHANDIRIHDAVSGLSDQENEKPSSLHINEQSSLLSLTQDHSDVQTSPTLVTHPRSKTSEKAAISLSNTLRYKNVVSFADDTSASQALTTQPIDLANGTPASVIGPNLPALEDNSTASDIVSESPPVSEQSTDIAKDSLPHFVLLPNILDVSIHQITQPTSSHTVKLTSTSQDAMYSELSEARMHEVPIPTIFDSTYLTSRVPDPWENEEVLERMKTQLDAGSIVAQIDTNVDFEYFDDDEEGHVIFPEENDTEEETGEGDNTEENEQEVAFDSVSSAPRVVPVQSEQWSNKLYSLLKGKKKFQEQDMSDLKKTLESIYVNRAHIAPSSSLARNVFSVANLPIDDVPGEDKHGLRAIARKSARAWGLRKVDI